MNPARIPPARPGFARWLRDSPTCQFGTWVKIPALETVEMLASAGFDFIVIDQEHAPMTLESAYRATVVAQGLGLQVLVRVPDRSESHMQRLLDIGVDGILVPRVTSAAETRAIVPTMVFSPQGDRGLGITSRAGNWGGNSREDYLYRGDAEVLRAVQLEDVSALEQVEEILGVPDLNGVFLGMGDLTLSSALPGDDGKLRELVNRLLRAAAGEGIPCGTAVQTAEQARSAAEQGFAYVLVSNDASLFRLSVTRLTAELRSLVGAVDREPEGARSG